MRVASYNNGIRKHAYAATIAILLYVFVTLIIYSLLQKYLPEPQALRCHSLASCGVRGNGIASLIYANLYDNLKEYVHAFALLIFILFLLFTRLRNQSKPMIALVVRYLILCELVSLLILILINIFYQPITYKI